MSKAFGGDISDYNSLKNQRDYGKTIKKYQSVKLKTEPTELQKYYQYQTYQQPILDELNYVAERMRTEDIKKKTEDYEFIEGLKIKKEGLMKETSKKEEQKEMETLFDKSSLIKNDDMTPVINTDVEMEYPTEPQPQPKIISNTPQIQTYMNDLFGEGNSVFDNILSIADTEPIREEKFELSKEKRYKTPEQLAEIEAKKAKTQAKKEAKKEAKKAETKAKKEAKKANSAAITIQNAFKNKKAIDEFSTREAIRELSKNKK